MVSKKAILKMELETQLHEAFIAEAALEERSASKIVSDLIRGYIQTRHDARGYEKYLKRKVDAARLSVNEGNGISNDEVEGMFSARRKQALYG